jgi:hypothetical protein
MVKDMNDFLRLNPKKPNIKPLAKIIFLLALIACCFNIVKSEINDSKIPGVTKGQVVLFSEEMSNSCHIKQIDVTDQYIYYAYGSEGVVAIYDWNGAYQGSLAFFSDTNGGLNIRCEDGLLYVVDFANYEYVIRGRDVIKTLEPDDGTHKYGWFIQGRVLPVTIEDGNVYDESGRYIMPLPGWRFWYERVKI